MGRGRGFVALGVVTLGALLAIGTVAEAAITVNKCQAGKQKCVRREVMGLLVCHAKAELKGALDPACLQKQKDKLDGGAKPAKGCFAKLEKKGGCLTTGDAAALDPTVQAFVLDVVQTLDPTYPAPVRSPCGAGKKGCVRKETGGLLVCHAKAELKGVLDPACVQKQQNKFDGGAKPAKGCFAKLEAKGGCPTTGDAAALQTKIDAFVAAVVCALDPSEGTCIGTGGTCTAPGFGGGEQPQTVTSASATITDLSGTAVVGLPCNVTGIDLSFPGGATQADGSVTVNVGHQLKRPAFRFGDAVTYPLLEIPLTLATTAFGSLATAPFPVSGSPLTPGTTATSGGVSVAVPAGATVLIDELTYDTPDKQQLRAVALPVGQEAAVVGPSGLGLELLFGVAPAQTLICPRATVTVPNDAAWPAGSAVEFYVLGSDVGQAWAPYGGWTKISDGAVSGDGASVSTAAGEGFPILEGVFGVRKTP